MDGWSDDMRRGLARLLNDVLTEVGLSHFDPGRLEIVVESSLLSEHGLGLDDLAHCVAARDLQHQPVDFITRFSPVHLCASRAGIALELLQQMIEMRESKIPYAPCRLSDLF